MHLDEARGCGLWRKTGQGDQTPWEVEGLQSPPSSPTALLQTVSAAQESKSPTFQASVPLLAFFSVSPTFKLLE